MNDTTSNTECNARSSADEAQTDPWADLGAAPTTVHDAAIAYDRLQWHCVPIYPHDEPKTKYVKSPGKQPRDDAWQKLVIGSQFGNLDKYFPEGTRDNIGVRLGFPFAGGAGKLMDVDLDRPRAVELAPFFLPNTAKFGRPKAENNHWLFNVTGDVTSKTWSRGEKDDDKAMIVELRGPGLQTIFPPSVHGDTHKPLAWSQYRKPTEIQHTDLVRRLCHLAVAELMCDHWINGKRYHVSLAFSRVLHDAGLSADEARDLCVAVATCTDSDATRATRTVDRTYGLIENDQPATGEKTLNELIDEDHVKLIKKWLGAVHKRTRQGREVNTGAALAQLNEKHFVVAHGAQAVVAWIKHDPEFERRVINYGSFTDVRNFYCNQYVVTGVNDGGEPVHAPLGKVWLTWEERRTYEGVVFDPSGRERPGIFNLWMGFAIEPAAGGECSLLIDMIRNDLAQGVKEHGEYILDWLAYCVQRPERVIGVALVLRGARGTGKGTLGRVMRTIFGQHGLQVTHGKSLSDMFNAHLRDVCLLFVDEALWAGDKSAQGALQGYITEDILPIRAMRTDLITAKNHLKLIMASNADWIVPANMQKERRYAVFDVSDAHAYDYAYFQAIYDQLEKDSGAGYAAFVHYLKTRDISKFDPRDYPKTDALLQQKIEGLTSVQAFWYNCLWTGELLPNDLWAGVTFGGEVNIAWSTGHAHVPKTHLYERYVAAATVMGERYRPTEAVFGKKFKELFVREPGETKPFVNIRDEKDGGIIYHRRQVRFHVLESLDDCRKQFEEVIGHAITWPKYETPKAEDRGPVSSAEFEQDADNVVQYALEMQKRKREGRE